MNSKQQVLSLFPLNADEGYYCECCGGFVKRYTRTFNCNMALALICLYKNRDKGFVHVEKLLQDNGHQRCGDFTYLRHYKLIEQLSEKRADGSNRNGYYKITGLGIMFIEGSTTVRENFKMFKGKCESFAGEEITIQQALGKKFNYNELMAQ